MLRLVCQFSQIDVILVSSLKLILHIAEISPKSLWCTVKQTGSPICWNGVKYFKCFYSHMPGLMFMSTVYFLKLSDWNALPASPIPIQAIHCGQVGPIFRVDLMKFCEIFLKLSSDFLKQFKCFYFSEFCGDVTSGRTKSLRNFTSVWDIACMSIFLLKVLWIAFLDSFHDEIYWWHWCYL